MLSHQDLLQQDQSARATALQVASSFIVQAPAGSGKTQLLIQRYLALLAGACEHPAQILALTFTRKAAATMRDRILAVLADAAQQRNESAWLPATWQLAQAAQQQAQRRGWQLRPQNLRISTIDSFCSEICQAAPDLTHLPDNFTLSATPELLYRRAARQLIYLSDNSAAWQPSLELALTQLDNQAKLLEQLLVRMLSQRESWIGIDFADAQAWRDFCARWLQDWRSRISPELGKAVADFAAGLYAHKDTNKLLLELADDWRSASWHAWRALGAHLLRADGGLRTRPVLTKAQDGNAANKLVIAELYANTELLELCRELLALPDLEANALEQEFSAAILQLALVAYANLKLLFAESAQVDYQEIAAQAVLALSSEAWRQHGSQRWQSIKHLLVDEFQDTSLGQWRLLQNLSSDWSADGSYSVFLVGDPMQSIYRFRQCDLRLFTRLWQQQQMGQLPVQALQLRQNFRSHKGLLEDINTMFEHIFPRQNDIRNAAVSYNQAIATHSRDDVALVKLYEQVSGPAYKEVVAYLQQLQHSQPQATRAVLLRQRTHAGSLLEVLRKHDIAYNSEQLLKPNAKQVIIDLRSLLAALADPLDELSWFALLRSPLCGCSLDELLQLRLDLQLSVWHTIQQADWQASLSEDRWARVRQLIESLAPVRDNWGNCDIARELRRCWQALGASYYAGAGDRALVDYFFYALQQSLSDGWLDFAVLDTLLGQNSALPSAAEPSDGSVQILTIHQAKGLQFDYVVLADLDQAPNVGNQSGYLSFIDDKYQAQLFAAKPYVEWPASRYAYLSMLDKRQQQFEVQRLLYVACTRAVRQLALHARLQVGDTSGTFKDPRANSLLALLWPHL